MTRKFAQAPERMEALLEKGMDEALEAVHESVPPYAPERPNQKYVRTQLLGRSLGSGYGGGAQGPPDILEVTLGSGFIEGRIGSKLGYAEQVIGYETQGTFFKGRWWTNNAWAIKATKKVIAVWERVVKSYADWMNA